MPGGSSNLYIMMHTRGHPSDFDNWAYQGAVGWAYKDLLPYFQKLERQEDPAGSWAGTAGRQIVTNAGGHDPNPLSRTFIDACVQLGYPEVADFNGPQMLGVGWHHIDVENGRRCGTLAAYLEPALNRPNLTLRTNAQAMKLVFEDQRCVGVTYRQEAPLGRLAKAAALARTVGQSRECRQCAPRGRLSSAPEPSSHRSCCCCPASVMASNSASLTSRLWRTSQEWATTSTTTS